MGIFQEFKKFALRGNVVDMAVGIIIGGAFGTVVKSLVDDVIMPPIGYFTSGVNFKDLSWPIKPSKPCETLAACKTAGAATLNVGSFINQVINFLIVAFAVFLLVRAVNRWMPKPAPPVLTKDCPQCAMPIPTAAKKCGHCTSAV